MPIRILAFSALRIFWALGLLWAAAGATAAFASTDENTAGQKVYKAHGIAMHGEPKYPADFKHFDYVNPDAPKGGMLRVGVRGAFDNFNGFIAKGNPAAGIGQSFETLMVSSADEPFTQYGLLAESVEWPEDRSWVAFTLRPEARWHDGKPVTPEDVVFSLNILKEKGHPAYRFYYQSIERVEKTGPRSVKFFFTESGNRELPLITGQLTILPKHYWEGRDFAKTTLEPPLGSGPYKVKSFEPSRYVVIERVEDYWGKDLPVNVGQNNFQTIRYDYFFDNTVIREALKAGDLDYRSENESKAWATAYDVPAVAEGWLVKEEIPHDRPQGMQGFAFNMRREMFRDKRVRQAIGLAFDFEWSNRNLFYDQYTQTKSYFDNSELAAHGLPEGRELEILEPYRGRVPDEVFTQEYQPPTTDGRGWPRDNLRKAFKLLAQAGWVVRDMKLVNEKTGEPMAFEILLVSKAFERIVLPFKRNLNRLGIEVEVRTIDQAQYINRLRQFDYDMIVASWGQSDSPGNEQREFWSCAAAEHSSSRNYVGICDPVIDELIQKVILAEDREDLVASVRALDRVLLWGYYVVPHWHIASDRIIYWDRFSRPETTPSGGTSVISYWWFDKKKDAALQQRLREVQSETVTQ